MPIQRAKPIRSDIPALTTSDMPTGSVVQQKTISYASTETISGTTPTATSMSISITPTSSSNDIVVDFHIFVSADKGEFSTWRIFRQIGSGSFTDASPASTINTYNTNNNGFLISGYIPSDTHHEHEYRGVSGSFTDSPATTSQVTYKLYGCRRSNGSGTAYLNRNNGYTASSDHASQPVSTAKVTEIVG